MADPRIHDNPTTTKAFKANFVPQVWMSFNKQDLLNPSHKRTDDIFDLKNTLRSFEFNFDQKKGEMGYRIKLINPTAEFEHSIMKHYAKLYPLDKGTYDNMVRDEERTTGLATSNFDTSSSPTMPQVFIRWGYGPKRTDGVSRIHKAILTEASFKLAANKDKEVNLVLVDPFSYTSKSDKFNNKGHAVTIPIIDEDKFRRPSEVVSEIITYYASIFPSTFVWGNLQGGFPSYTGSIDQAFARMVMALNKPGDDTVSQARKDVHGAGESPDDISSGEIEFSKAELDALNESLTSKIPTDLAKLADKSEKKAGEINANIIAQAYKYLLNALGMNLKLGISLSDSEQQFLLAKNQSGKKDAPPNLVEDEFDFTLEEGQLVGESLADFKDKDVIEPFLVEVYELDWRGNPTGETVELVMEEGAGWTGTGGEDMSCNDLESILAGRQGAGEVLGNPEVEVEGRAYDYELTNEGKKTVMQVLAATQRQHDDATGELTATVLPGGKKVALPDEYKQEPDLDSKGGKISTGIKMGAQQYYATLGTIGSTPIDKVLKNVIKAINQFILGTAQDPLSMQPINLNMLTNTELEELAVALKMDTQAKPADYGEVEKAERIEIGFNDLKKYDQVLIIASEHVLRHDIAQKFLVNRIYSFPEIVSDAPEHNGLVWMRYGFPDSIVGKLDFKSDNRALFDLMQSNYMVRQQNDFREFFGGSKADAGHKLQGMINYIIDHSGAEGSADVSGASKVTFKITDITGTEKDTAESVNEVTGDTISFLDSMAKAYTHDQEAFDGLVYGENNDKKYSAEDFRIFFSIVRDRNMKNMLFPTSNIDSQKNEQRQHIAHVMEGGKLKVKQKKTFILRKRLDLSIVEQFTNTGENRVFDNAAAFAVKVGKEAWQLKISTLGIPEMDLPVAEMQHRRFLLEVREPRSPQSNHWLSGPYRILGLKHKIDPSKGYITEFSLMKDASLMAKFGKTYQHNVN